MFDRQPSDVAENNNYGVRLSPEASESIEADATKGCMFSRPKVRDVNLADFVRRVIDAKDAKAGLEGTEKPLPKVLMQLILSYIAPFMRYTIQVLTPQDLFDHSVERSVGQTNVKGWLAMLEELKMLGSVPKLPFSVVVAFLCSSGIDEMHLNPIFTEGMFLLAGMARKCRVVFADFGLPPMAHLLLHYQEKKQEGPNAAQLVECSSTNVSIDDVSESGRPDTCLSPIVSDTDAAESKQPPTGCPLGQRTGMEAKVSVVNLPGHLDEHLHPAILALVVAHRADGDAQQQPPEKKQCLQSVSSGECAVQERRVVCTIRRQGGTYTFGHFSAPWERNGPNSFHNTQNGIIAHVVLYDGEFPLYVVFVLSDTCTIIGFSAHFCELKWVDENVAQQIAQHELEASGMDAKMATECVRSMPRRALTEAVSDAMRMASDMSAQPFGALVKTLSSS